MDLYVSWAVADMQILGSYAHCTCVCMCACVCMCHWGWNQDWGGLHTLERLYYGKRVPFSYKTSEKGEQRSWKTKTPWNERISWENKRKFLRSQSPSTCNPAAQDSGVILDKQDETQTKQQYALTRHRTKHKGKARLKVQERGRNIQQPESSCGVLSIPDNRLETGDVVRERQVSV